ncbi:MAG: DUF2817 domain-containing protein [Nocardioides sp.]|uniref:M14 family zinc carboxypeptidase n=1 Tax=Nocardioides sp. TaxID=35761 RepID=UPI0039E239D6
MRQRSAVWALALAVTLSLLTATTPAVSQSLAHDAVIQRKVIGHSVKKRPIVALRLGEPGKRVIVMFAAMHGNETAPSKILHSLADGPPVHGIDLWVVPTYNPDGVARHTRQNARGVDLNRNFPYRWVKLRGTYNSGRKPASEPETRAVMRFLRKVRPSQIISFHQPLYGVDTDTKRPAFARRLARALHLPATSFDCGGVCHGTMTGWYNHRFKGSALTVEYNAHPARARMRQRAPKQLIRVLGASRGR